MDDFASVVTREVRVTCNKSMETGVQVYGHGYSGKLTLGAIALGQP